MIPNLFDAIVHRVDPFLRSTSTASKTKITIGGEAKTRIHDSVIPNLLYAVVRRIDPLLRPKSTR